MTPITDNLRELIATSSVKPDGSCTFNTDVFVAFMRAAPDILSAAERTERMEKVLREARENIALCADHTSPYFAHVHGISTIIDAALADTEKA